MSVLSKSLELLESVVGDYYMADDGVPFRMIEEIESFLHWYSLQQDNIK